MNARGERGFALLLVLWSMAMIALIGARVTASGGGEARIARVALDRALLEQAADGAVHDAMFHLAGGTWTWRTAPAAIGIGRVAVALRLADEGGRVNLNQAPRGLIEALLLAVGLPADRAATLADAIAAWRSAGNRADARPCDASFAITLLPEESPPPSAGPSGNDAELAACDPDIGARGLASAAIDCPVAPHQRRVDHFGIGQRRAGSERMAVLNGRHVQARAEFSPAGSARR